MVDTGTVSPDAHTASAYVSERFLVKGGLIHEIEALFWPAPGLAPTEPAW